MKDQKQLDSTYKTVIRIIFLVIFMTVLRTFDEHFPIYFMGLFIAFRLYQKAKSNIETKFNHQ